MSFWGSGLSGDGGWGQSWTNSPELVHVGNWRPNICFGLGFMTCYMCVYIYCIYIYTYGIYIYIWYIYTHMVYIYICMVYMYIHTYYVYDQIVKQVSWVRGHHLTSDSGRDFFFVDPAIDPWARGWMVQLGKDCEEQTRLGRSMELFGMNFHQ